MFIQFTPYLKNEKLLAIRSFEIFCYIVVFLYGKFAASYTIILL